MFFSFSYLALRALLDLLVRSRRGPDIKETELMVPRHELGLLRRHVERPTVRIVDRALLAAAACHPAAFSGLGALVTLRTLTPLASSARRYSEVLQLAVAKPVSRYTARHAVLPVER
jgi:hypothetical protein